MRKIQKHEASAKSMGLARRRFSEAVSFYHSRYWFQALNASRLYWSPHRWIAHLVSHLCVRLLPLLLSLTTANVVSSISVFLTPLVKKIPLVIIFLWPEVGWCFCWNDHCLLLQLAALSRLPWKDVSSVVWHWLCSSRNTRLECRRAWLEPVWICSVALALWWKGRV